MTTQISTQYNQEYFNKLYREAFTHGNWKALRFPFIQSELKFDHFDFIYGFLSAYAALCLQYCFPRLRDTCHCKHSPNPAVKRTKHGNSVLVGEELLLSKYEKKFTSLSRSQSSELTDIMKTSKEMFHNIRCIRNMLNHFMKKHFNKWVCIERECGFHKVFEMFISVNMIRPANKKHPFRIIRRPITKHKVLP